MNTAIFMLYWVVSGIPIVIHQELGNLDSCKSMKIEVERMIKHLERENNMTPGKNSSFKTFCHMKTIE